MVDVTQDKTIIKVRLVNKGVDNIYSEETWAFCKFELCYI